ncbi:GT2 family glycosyltransferase [Paraburkholderia sp. BL6669N2]|uniref:glycosyltransferase n=1 Tax=Paraburkholderia sp. BL6669N2 TaxID=1938807 RepID=UPI000E258141|nr:glycosyltransferase [Paraburkholderia sp. BL6669N2]REG51821.1 GT2 family glycosyltransferase [Paraburkholderia sp. BL6669N2]
MRQDTINSNAYWDQRFSHDWESNGGQEQSRFFAEVAIEAMPQWLSNEIKWNKLTVCDWGCAQGDGTEALAQSLCWDVTGIDFSGPAIETAQQRYSRARFLQENLLDNPTRPRFDVVFSSNTLEHFANPWRVFDQIAEYASRFVVLLLPYREFNRHAEHEVTFDGRNIPVAPNPAWSLVYHSVVDTRLREPSYWLGEQILLVFARTEWLAARHFSLADLTLYETREAARAWALDSRRSLEHPFAMAEVHAERVGEQLRTVLAAKEARHARELEIACEELKREQARAGELDAQLIGERSRATVAEQRVVVEEERAAQLHLEINMLRAQLETTRAQVEKAKSAASLQDSLDDERDKTRQLSEENATHLAKAHQLEERLHFLQYRERALATEISTLLATKSWRMTAPLRALRGSPDWMKRRLRDVNYAYVHGGARNVLYRSAGCFAKHLKRSRQQPAVVLPAASSAVTMATPVTTASGPASVVARSSPRALADVFVFSIIDWHFRIQRPQHLAREFARAGHRVYFFSNHFEDAKEPGFSVEQLDETLPLYQIKLKVDQAPAIYFSVPAPKVIEQILEGLRLFRQWSGTTRSYALVQHGYWAPVATRLQAECVAYDCMDHHEGFGNVPRELLDLEETMMRRADLLVATSSWLEDHARQYNPHVEVIRNAGQYQDFCHPPVDRFVDRRGRRVIGYYGAIAEWFDAELVARVAEEFPDALILLVGADTAGVAARLSVFTNVEMVGEVPYARLPYYLYAFDVCMLPFKVMPLTLATNPVKIYEYLGAGSSVVSIDLPEMKQFGDLVRIAATHDEFLEQIRRAVTALPDAKRIVDQRKAFAAGQTWAHRVESFRRAIDALPRAKVSAIVLTYNNLPLTKDCLESLEQQDSGVDLEIVVVDNASTDGSADYLVSWAASRPNAKLILNAENRGFAGGNNVGLAAATGDYLVILNNDTVVTRGWARRMVNHFRNHPRLGILGPLTNNIGNEARVETNYVDLPSMHPEAAVLTEPNLGMLFELDTVAFFCAMLPRSTFELCGPLCEDYGLGFFEDDDYCRRVQAAGLVVGCAEDVFIHHHLSASFNQLGAERKRQLLETNRAIYESKWGPWTPHQYRRHGAKRAWRTFA